MYANGTIENQQMDAFKIKGNDTGEVQNVRVLSKFLIIILKLKNIFLRIRNLKKTNGKSVSAVKYQPKYVGRETIY